MSNSQPKWATLDRQNLLVQLFLDSGGFCVYGHKKCQVAEHHYHLYIEYLIKDWQQMDRDTKQAEAETERLAMHNLGERRYPLVGRFSAISKDIYASQQPLYYFQGQSISGLTLQPFVKIRLASSYMRLFIDLGDTLRQVSKSKRRKAIRYGKPLPQEVKQAINRKILAAVRDYM